MEIKEIDCITIDGKRIMLPATYWLDLKNGLIDKKISIVIECQEFEMIIDGNNFVSICKNSDLLLLFNRLKIEFIDLKYFRFKNIVTKKWGEKIIYEEGAKGVCFNCCYFKSVDKIYLIFLNTGGTKEIENIYIHGIWKIYNVVCMPE